ncbi:MAG: lysophospholipid acyltransferase family protein [Candidatus Puniceispirillales bacterium]
MIKHLAKRIRQGLGWPLEAAIVYALVWLIRITPVRFASAFGGALFGTIGPISPWNRRVIFNIGYAMPETDSGQRRRIARQAWHNMGRVVGEFFHIETLMKSGYVSLEGGEHLDPERGGMLIGAHLGCWELIGGPALMQGYAASCVYRPTNNPLVNALLHKRNRVYTRVYEKGRDGARGITETIRRKEFFSMLVDQKLREGIMLDFFGHKASTAVAHVKAALRMDVPILMVQMVRVGGCHQKLIVRPLDLKVDGRGRKADMPENVAEIASRINTIIEGWIRENPGQWLWHHRRWPASKGEAEEA